jgi:hypothetical protein
MTTSEEKEIVKMDKRVERQEKEKAKEKKVLTPELLKAIALLQGRKLKYIK